MKTIVIDGQDGSGKETQTKILKENLENLGFKVKMVSFPVYENDSSILVKRYLNGDYGQNPNMVNPYSASVLYSVDRLNFFLTQDLSDVDILLCDRYTTSNILHQASKIENLDRRESYINWLKDLEYNKFQIPRPDLVLYLDLDQTISQELIHERMKKTQGKDIHENNQEYLSHLAHAVPDIIKNEDWEVIKCSKNNKLRSIEDIQKEILEKTLEVLDG